MNNDKKYTLAMTVALTIAVTSIVAFAIVFLNRSKQLPVEKETEFIYVNVLSESTITESVTEEADNEVFIVKEYLSRIGIFNENGKLLDIIDIYTKTLPQADINLLREGIRVTSRKELNALIEDYSS